MNIKLQYQGELKKLSQVKGYTDLLSKGISRFRLVPSNEWKLYYFDESSDPISISSQEELEEAF